MVSRLPVIGCCSGAGSLAASRSDSICRRVGFLGLPIWRYAFRREPWEASTR